MKKFIATLLLGAVSTTALSTDAKAETVLGWWSQIIGETGTPKANDSPGKLNIEARFVFEHAGVTQAEAQKICDTYSLKDQNGVALKATWTARYSAGIYSNYAVCATGFSDDEFTSATLTHGNNGAAVMVDMRQPDDSFTKAKAIFPGTAPVGKSGNGLKVAVFGDSGCRGGNDQGCYLDHKKAKLRGKHWVFPYLIDDSLSQKADVALHVGDYRYRGQRTGQAWGWDNWGKDLFAAAQPSFAQVPWAFSRGNHETCVSNYSGPGFYLLFGRTQDACEGTGFPTTTLMEPWYFDLADRTGAKPKLAHRFIMVDNGSNADDDQHRDAYLDALIWANIGWSGNAASAWIISHRPIFGLDTFSMNPQNDLTDVGFLRRAVEEAEQHTDLNQKIAGCAQYDMTKCGLKAIVGGHQHNFQNLVFPKNSTDTARLLPQQFVVGHSGVLLRDKTKHHSSQKSYLFTHGLRDAGLSSCPPNKQGFRHRSNVTGAVVDWVSRSGSHHDRKYDYGYVVFTRNGSEAKEQSGWSGTARFADGRSPALNGQIGTVTNVPSHCLDPS